MLRSGRAIVLWEAVAWGVAALLVRLPLAIAHGLDWDETLSAHTTFRMLREGRWLPYQSGQAYMGTLQELLNALSISLLGPSAFALRLPSLILVALSIGLTYTLIQQIAGRFHARVVAMLMVFMNSSLGFFSYRSMAEYPLALFLSLVLLQLTTWCDRKRTPIRFAALGLLAGVSLYTFAITGIPFVVGLLWLLFRSEYASRCLVAWADPQLRTRIKRTLALGAVATLFFLILIYRYLTRSQTYLPGTVEQLALGSLLVSSIVIVWSVLRMIPVRRGEVGVLICCLGPAIALPAVASYWHRTVIAPELVEAGVNPWNASAYSLRHAHEWPSQVNLLFGHIIPDLVAGQRSSYVTAIAMVVSLSWIGAFVLGLVCAALIILVRPLRLLGRLSEGRVWLFATPPIILTLVMLPSWRLNNDGSLRYYFVCVPGLYLMASLLALRLSGNRPSLVCAMVVGYAIYSTWDLVANSPPNPPNPDADRVAQVAAAENAQMILTQGELGKELVWATRGRIVVVDATNPKVNWWYLRRDDVKVTDFIVSANLDADTIRSALGPDAARYRPVRQYPGGIVIYQKQ